MSNYLILRDNSSLTPLTETSEGDGKVFDLYNTSIHQRINGEYTVTFDILPYLDVWRVNYPNIVELDGDYFQVCRIEKNRTNTLAMRVDLEHISYELNNSVLDFEEDENPELEYEGTPHAILTEMLEGTRFSIGLVDSSESIEFITTQKGIRNRILELAAFCNLEVKFDKFSVALLSRRGNNHGVTLEVGENITSMTEVTELQIGGELVRSYEVDIVDLNYIEEDDVPLEAFEVHLGDTLQLIDSQFGISYVDRVYSITYDPFKKMLPQFEFLNRISNTANTTTSTDVANTVEIYQEEITRNERGNAFGLQTKATNMFTFASGLSSEASGFGSNAFGQQTKAIGDCSVAMGYQSEANGRYGVAMGYETKAKEDYSVAMGHQTEATGDYSVALGHLTKASGNCALSHGRLTEASGLFSVAMGSESVANNVHSVAMGYKTESSGSASFTAGDNTKATGPQSTAFGFQAQASEFAATAVGYGTLADGPFMIAGGTYNKSYGGGMPVLMALGNGSDDNNRSNAFRVDIDGQAYVQSTFNSGGADYAEYFEWVDGNVNNEDRRGLFVTLDDDKIRLANDGDYILGIVSVTPSIVGDSFEDTWKDMYARDHWGQVVLDADGNKMINPQYDETKEYVPRSKRPEWSTVGMLGKLLVRDDGTCAVNGFVNISVDGIATASADGYRVLKRVTDNIVQILFK